MTRSKCFGVCFALLAFAAMSAKAEERDFRTLINVKGMTCQGCANKLIKELQQIPGVATAQADAKKGIAVTVPKDTQQLPSPLAQWEAVEKLGYEPIRLAGPFGVFTSKPKPRN